jgi:uncharacterized protein YyaL (SSP411 family)
MMDHHKEPHQGHSHTNRLAKESSPYLLQHAHNPVDWFPWGEEALEKARNENKLLLISIGYSACHWCHVMEQESFMDPDIAGIMNRSFVCVKVDREERPDVDQVYMTAVQLLTGRGGWPLNCFAIPGGDPVYGGTYFRPHEWREVLEKLSQAWATAPGRFREHAKELKSGVVQSDLIVRKKEPHEFTPVPVVEAIRKWKKDFDPDEGGNMGAPKFPLPNSMEFLIQYDYYHDDEQVRAHVIRTLDKMMQGGLYDHVEGGFARYATDRAWRVPHFEKMLYDNAQLVGLYSHAFRRFKRRDYLDVVTRTLGFISEHMRSGDGGFYSSFDADSEGIEGRYYIWKKQEFDALLGSDAELLALFYNVSEPGNWEPGNILFQSGSIPSFCKDHDLDEGWFRNILRRGLARLKSARLKRVKPALDDKILTGWNALMMQGYLEAYRATQSEEYLQTAIENARFLLGRIQEDGRLRRSHAPEGRTIDGFLDDYAFTIEALTSLYSITFDIEWLHCAKKLTGYTMNHFFDSRSGMFYFTSDADKVIVARKMEITDNVVPSSNSVMAANLYRLGVFFQEPEYTRTSEQMLHNVREAMQNNGPYHSNWAMQYMRFIHPQNEVVIMGENVREIRPSFDAEYHPDVLLAGHSGAADLPLLKGRFVEGKNLIYVCRDNTCHVPVASVEAAIDQLNSVGPAAPGRQ